MTIEWWTQQQAGVVFGSLGAGVGILGGLLGTFVGLGARKGRFKLFSFSLHALGSLVGIVALSIGIAAIASSQPYHIWYPPIMLGAMCIGIFTGLFFLVTRPAYAAADQRRLDANLMRNA